MRKEAERKSLQNLPTARDEQLGRKNEETERLKSKIKQLEKKDRAVPGTE